MNLVGKLKFHRVGPKISDEKIDEMVTKGKSTIEQSTGIEVENIEQTKHLLNIEKGGITYFQISLRLKKGNMKTILLLLRKFY